MRGGIPPLPQYVFMAWCLVKHRETLPYLLHKLLVSINGSTLLRSAEFCDTSCLIIAYNEISLQICIG